MVRRKIVPLDKIIKETICREQIKIIRTYAESNIMPIKHVDFSIYPRIISAKEHKNNYTLCKRILQTLFNALPGILAHSDIDDQYAQELSKLPHREEYTGLMRLDFLEEDESLKLIEINSMSVGGFIGSLVNELFINNYETLAAELHSPNPLRILTENLARHGVNNIALLTVENTTGDEHNIYLIKNSKQPTKVTLIPENHYSRILFLGNKAFNDNEKYDALMLRNMDYPQRLLENLTFTRHIYASSVPIIDDIRLAMIENKDLGYIMAADPKLAKHIARTLTPDQAAKKPKLTVSKTNGTHGGVGVSIGYNPAEGSAVYQRRVFTNKMPVHTIEGKKGNARYDTSIFIFYSAHKSKIEYLEIAGYLTRGSMNNEILNISQGGFVIPTLVEKVST